MPIIYIEALQCLMEVNMKYNVKYSCGHDGMVDLGGKVSERENMLKWYESVGLCPDCYKAKMKDESDKEKKYMDDLYRKFALCNFKGSNKQIAYAEKFRSHFVKTVDNVYKDDVPPIILDMFKNMDSAQWFITHALNDTLVSAYEEMLMNAHRIQDNESENDTKADTYIIPKNKTKDGEIEISKKSNYISIRFPYNKECIEIAHVLYYRWNSSAKEWYLNLDETAGDPNDRIAEACSHYLTEGYIVNCDSKEARAKLESGDWKPLYTRWIDYNAKLGTFKILCREKEDKVYKYSRNIKGNIYKDYCVQIPEHNIDEIKDFASLFDFEYTKRALCRLTELERETLIMQEDPVINQTVFDDDKLEKILDNNSIPVDLYDD